MKELGLDKRHRDKNGEIQQKRSDALNKNFSKPISQFSPNVTLGQMRKATGKESEAAVPVFGEGTVVTIPNEFLPNAPPPTIWNSMPLPDGAP
jgi:hypothetical protein